jgi:4'-phosphopantetheinyl transferase EntD
VDAQIAPSRSFRQILPSGVIANELRGSAHPYVASLSAEENIAIAFAVPSRRLEFAAGRACARKGLEALGLPPGVPLAPRADRSPTWPAQCVGSITHTQRYVAAAVALRSRFIGIGIDAEVCGRVEQNLWPLIFTDSEVLLLRRLPASEASVVSTLLFSAKEAIYKAIYPHTRVRLDFLDVAVQLAGPGEFTAQAAREPNVLPFEQRLRGRYRFDDTLVLCAVTVDA